MLFALLVYFTFSVHLFVCFVLLLFKKNDDNKSPKLELIELNKLMVVECNELLSGLQYACIK